MWMPLISEKEYYSIVQQTFVFQTLQNNSNLTIYRLYGFQIHGPIFSRNRMIRVIKRDIYQIWIYRVLLILNKGTVRIGYLYLCKKRLPLLSFTPVRTII